MQSHSPGRGGAVVSAQRARSGSTAVQAVTVHIGGKLYWKYRPQERKIKLKDDLWGQSFTPTVYHVRTEGVALLLGVTPGCWACSIHEHKA